MAVEERDPHTGYTTIGHEWGGITELNRPVPRVVWLFLTAAFLFSVVYWVLMPAWPLVETYTKGVLGVTQRGRLAQDLKEAALERAAWTDRIAASGFAEIQADAALMKIVREAGRPLFEDNCAVCHGMKGEGGVGFPRLTDGAWLWGGDPEAVAETVRVGINAAHDETRVSQMQAFGRDEILDRQAILDVVAHVRSLSGAEAGSEAGAEAFAANCAACHGEDGAGNPDLGAPDLTDDFWIYGGDRQSLYMTVYGGRQGQMPHWEGRLSALERKMLTLFVIDLGAAARR